MSLHTLNHILASASSYKFAKRPLIGTYTSIGAAVWFNRGTNDSRGTFTCADPSRPFLAGWDGHKCKKRQYAFI